MRCLALEPLQSRSRLRQDTFIVCDDTDGAVTGGVAASKKNRIVSDANTTCFAMHNENR